MVTPPVEVITTTIATCGWSSSTSTRWIVAVSIGGAVTSASRFGHLRELLGGGAHRLVDLAAHRGQLDLAPRHRQLALGEQLVDVEAVAAIGRHATRRGVRVLEQPGLLEVRQLGADGRGAPGHVALLGDPLGADGLVQLDVSLDQLAQDEASGGS